MTDTAPLNTLIDLIADALVADYLRETQAANTDESTASGPPLARTGTDGE